jgi:aldose sugar dehydrogenase
MRRFLFIISSITLLLGAAALTFAVIEYVNTQKIEDVRKSQPVSPELTATVVAEGLEHPWDVDFLPDETVIFTERSGAISTVENGQKRLLGSIADVRATGEGGLLGIAVDPMYETTNFIFACLNSTEGDIRVVRWKLQNNELQAREDIITDIPSAQTGRHSGCQLAFGPDNSLWVGAGDAADETQPQNQSSLGGKILRVDRDGKAAADNPPGPDRRVFSYGHRNIQAIAFYPSLQDTSYGVSVEHGPDRDDEVNELKPGNFGWSPLGGYDENVPMTDVGKFPDAIGSTWSSGDSTIAPSGAAFLRSKEWGRFEGWLAVSVLKDKQLLLLNAENGSVSGERSYFENEFGRLRAATLGPDGGLYVSTDNGTNDKILRISPVARD